jgi:hypothetical protein
MAAMTTALTLFNTQNNYVQYSLNDHTTVEPRVVIQKRKVPSGVLGVGETSIKVVYGTTNSDGDQIAERISFEVIVRDPVQGLSTDRDAALAVFRDIIAGDEFANSVGTQEWLS